MAKRDHEYEVFVARTARIIGALAARITHLEIAIKVRLPRGGIDQYDPHALEYFTAFSPGAYRSLAEQVRQELLAPIEEEKADG